MSLGDLEAQFHDEFERAHGSVAVILFFDIGEVFVGDQAGMRLEDVAALRAVNPALGQP